MFKAHISRPWICTACLTRRFRLQHRHRSSAAAAQADPPRVVHHTAPGAVHDDKTLRQIFDSPHFWKDFASSSRVDSRGRNVGLVRNRYLTSPRGFVEFSQSNLRKAKSIVQHVLQASTTEEYRRIVKDLDRLSDMLCRVIDLSDFVKATHPDTSMQAAASYAYSRMYEYMNQLNTMTGLNEQLAVAMSKEEVVRTWTEEERVVTLALRKDFENSGIALPRAMRERFVSISQEISNVGPAFVDHMEPAVKSVSVPSSKLFGMDPRMVKSLTKWGKTTVPIAGDVTATVLRTVHDEETRREVFMASRTASKSQLGRLQDLLTKRADLAKLTDRQSYGHMALADKMAKSPESVNQFLSALSASNRPRALKERRDLLAMKERTTSTLNPALQPWDKDYYIHQSKAAVRSNVRAPDFLSAYFSLGIVMQGLSRLFTRLYGVRLAPRETDPGETWNDDVRRLDVISETDGHVAVLYCDLFSRPGKSPNPAHFTLRCSREIGHHEVEEEYHKQNSLFSSAEEAANDGMATSDLTGNLKQLPTIALICDFYASSSPSLLSFNEVETLFHEMGHAIHSILGRTSLQEVSGTRCATDFAELPSVLMEHFAADPHVLALFARHHETDQPLPYALVAEKLSLDQCFRGLEKETQIVLALVDQAYHSALPLSSSFDSTRVFHDTQRSHSVLPPDPDATAWQGFFGHLFGYGSSYYSYLFDTVLAERIWKRVFNSGTDGGSISRENGERMKEHVLKWGGGRDPWHCIADVLDDGRVAHGGEQAMAVVGGWGTKGRDV